MALQIITAVVVVVACILFGLCIFGTLTAIRRKKAMQACPLLTCSHIALGERGNLVICLKTSPTVVSWS